jgi:hypothetical protein
MRILVRILIALSMVILFGCENIFGPSADPDPGPEIIVNSNKINPWKYYEVTLENSGGIPEDSIVWSVDHGDLLSRNIGKQIYWQAPRKITPCKIHCDIRQGKDSRHLLKTVVVENKKPVLRNTRTYRNAVRYLFLNTEVYDEDNANNDISYNFDSDPRLIVEGYGNEALGEDNLVFLAFGIPQGEDRMFIPGNYWVTLRIFDFVDTVEVNHTFVVE